MQCPCPRCSTGAPTCSPRAGASSAKAKQRTGPPACSGTPSTRPLRAPAGCTPTCTRATSCCSRAAASACWTSALSPRRPAASPRRSGSSPPPCSPGTARRRSAADRRAAAPARGHRGRHELYVLARVAAGAHGPPHPATLRPGVAQLDAAAAVRPGLAGDALSRRALRTARRPRSHPRVPPGLLSRVSRQHPPVPALANRRHTPPRQLRQREGGGAVAQVVEPDRRQVKLLDECAEPVDEVLGPDRPIVGVGEHRPALPPAGARAGAGVAAAVGR